MKNILIAEILEVAEKIIFFIVAVFIASFIVAFIEELLSSKK